MCPICMTPKVKYLLVYVNGPFFVSSVLYLISRQLKRSQVQQAVRGFPNLHPYNRSSNRSQEICKRPITHSQ
jgi:hypothetical protein